MNEELEMLKRLEALSVLHKDIDEKIDKLSTERYRNDFELHRLKRERLGIRDEIVKLQDAIYPDIIA